MDNNALHPPQAAPAPDQSALSAPPAAPPITARQKLLFSLLPNVSDSIWAGLLFFVIQFGRSMMNADGDLGRHLTIGAAILAVRRVPTSDIFSHTMMGMALVPHEWLSEVIFALAYRLLGFAGVILVCALLIASTFRLVYRMAAAPPGSLFAAILVTLLAIFASLLHWLARPHLFTFLLLALWCDQLERMRRHSGAGLYRRWWLFPLLMLLWANLHGAFIAGFVTFALYGAGMAVDALQGAQKPGGRWWIGYGLAGGSALLVTLLNPAGLGLWTTSVGYLGSSFLVNTTIEYLSPNFHSLSTQPFLVMIGMALVLFGLRRRSLPAAQVLACAAWLLMALYSARNIPLFAIVAAPPLAALLSDWLELAAAALKPLRGLWKLDQGLLRLERLSPGWLYPLLALAVITLALVTQPNGDLRARITYDPQKFPVAAVDWLEQHPQSGPVFNEFAWGGYLLYRLWPEQLVFIDGQTDFYGEALTQQYLQVMAAQPGWQQVLDRYQVTWLLLPANDVLPNQLKADPGWKMVYEDQTAQIFVRANGGQ